MIVGHIGGSASDIDTGDIQKSLRFAASRSTYLSRTFGTPTNQSKWTWSGWIKRGKLGALQNIFSRTINASANFNVYIDVDDTLTLMTSNTTYITTNQVFRDPTAWFHLGVIYDSANATPSLRVRIYVNGVEITSFSVDIRASVSPSQDSWNTTITGNIHAIMSTSNPSYYHDGYLSRVCFVDGQALTPSSFGYLNTEINEWVTNSQSEVKAVVDAGGANSFMLDFDDGTSLTTLGYDKSSKGNNWTLNNHSLTTGANYDWMEDVPGNSFATLNPLNASTSAYLTNGNLDSVVGTAQSYQRGTISIPQTGKWYFEDYPLGVNGGASQQLSIGLVKEDTSVGSNFTGAGHFTLYMGFNDASSALYINNDGSNSGSNTVAAASMDTFRMAYDADTGKLWLGFKTSWRTSAGADNPTADPENGISPTLTITPGTKVQPFVHSYNNTVYANFGQAPRHASATYHSVAGGYFRYAPPIGFKALNQRNLPDGSSVTLSGSFTGNASTDGPAVWLNGSPDTLTINGNAVTFGTHADRLATGFKVRSSSASYNTAGSNTFVATITSNQKNCFKYNNAKDNT